MLCIIYVAIINYSYYTCQPYPVVSKQEGDGRYVGGHTILYLEIVFPKIERAKFLQGCHTKMSNFELLYVFFLAEYSLLILNKIKRVTYL